MESRSCFPRASSGLESAQRSVVLLAFLTLLQVAGGSAATAQITPQIVNGAPEFAEATTGALLEGLDPTTAVVVCSATLIGCDTAITAAHCFNVNASLRKTLFFQHAGFFDDRERRPEPGLRCLLRTGGRVLQQPGDHAPGGHRADQARDHRAGDPAGEDQHGAEAGPWNPRSHRGLRTRSARRGVDLPTEHGDQALRLDDAGGLPGSDARARTISCAGIPPR